MTRKELSTLAPGSIVYDKAHGLPFEFVMACPCWNGFLPSKDLAERKPDSYDLLLKPVNGQDYYGLYKFENHFTFGRGLYIDSKQLKLS